MLCDICLHRSFGVGGIRGQQEEIAEVEKFDRPSISPTESWDSPRAAAATPVPCTPMPEVVSTCDGAFDHIVGQNRAIEVDDGDAELVEDEDPAPRTPKRQVDHQAAASTTTSPVKQARQEAAEPTNGDLMMFLQTMQKQQAAALQGLAARIQGTETRLDTMQNQTAAKFDSIEKQLNEVRAEAKKKSNDRITSLEKSMTDKMQKLTVRMDEYAARPTATTSPAPSTSNFDDTVVIIGGIPQETPRGALEAAWTNDIQNLVAAHIDLTHIRVEASYLLSSSLQARCSSSSQARRAPW